MFKFGKAQNKLVFFVFTLIALLPGVCGAAVIPALLAPFSGAYVSISTPVMTWSTAAANNHRLQLATDAALTAVIADSTTANTYYISTNTLIHGATYWWRVSADNTNWSPVFSFVLDIAAPSFSNAQVSTDPASGPWTSLPMATYLSSTGASVRLTVQDPDAGLLVSTGYPSGLVAHWHFDESSGTVALDASNNSLTAITTASWISGGKRGGAVRLNGGRQIDPPTSASLSMTNAVSVSAWVNIEAGGTFQRVFEQGAIGGTPFLEYALIVSSSNKARFAIGTAIANEFDGATTLPLNTWVHIAGTWDGAIDRVYVNGVLDGAQAVAGPIVEQNNRSTIGYRLDVGQGTQNFKGSIDELRVYSVGLSSAEVLAQYQSDTLNAHNRGKAYNVHYSTNAGRTWNYVPANSVTLSGGNGDKTPLTLQADGLQLVTSTGPGAPTNKINVTASDMAGNVSTATYVVLVDTTATLAGSFAVSAVNLSSITVSLAVGGATTYSVIASTAADFTGTLFLSSTTDTSVLSMTVGALARNTTYYLRLDAYGIGVDFSSSVVAATLAAVPSPLSFTSIGLSQFTVSWPANGNPSGTQYQVYVGTDIAFATISQSSFTAMLSSTFTSLSSLTTYYVRARAVNSAGTPTAYALGAVLTVNGVVTVSANRLTGLWYNAAATLFFAQGAHHYYYKVTANPGDVPTGADTLYDGADLTVAMPAGSNYFHVLGPDASDLIDIGTAHFGPVNIDLGLPVVPSIAAQNSATDTTPIPDGGSTLAATPRLSWPAAVSASPVVGYSLSLSTNQADAPGPTVTTTINFIDRVLTLSQVYYAKVAALNLAGTLGPVAAMSFTFSSTPNADRIILRNNYFNPLRGGCTQLEVDVAAAGHLRSVIYDYTGQRIVSLADRDVTAGVYTYSWCGRNSSGALVSSGVYLLHVEAPGQKKNLKLIILK